MTAVDQSDPMDTTSKREFGNAYDFFVGKFSNGETSKFRRFNQQSEFSLWPAAIKRKLSKKLKQKPRRKLLNGDGKSFINGTRSERSRSI